jgi:MFS family permease
MGDLAVRYWGSFFICAFLCVVFQVIGLKSDSSNAIKSTNGPQNGSNISKFKGFQMNYLVVFLLAMFSDWLQGPYVYELYVSYGFNQQQIAELFVCGFASSMIVGTFAGSLADSMGRRTMCVVYCVCYILACLTKTVPEYWTLMVGRFLSGVSTSLLFCAFESWMVCEHFKQGHESSWLGDTFAYATFGNGLVAVLAGLVANSVASSFGFVAPFIVALLPLTLVAAIVIGTWSENYGNQTMSLVSSMTKSFNLIRSDWRIASLGLAQSTFEGAMYSFVFMWTPALKSDNEQGEETTSAYLGLIFAVFMVCVMIGSSLFKMYSQRRDMLYKIPIFLHLTAFASMAMITIFFEYKIVVYAMFLVFEMTVGLFYPSYGVIKSEKIPEDIRSAVMSIFRIPLNAFVVLLLLKIKFMPAYVVFMICAATHFFSFLAYMYFYLNTRTSDKSESRNNLEEGMELLGSNGGSKDNMA